MAQMTATAVITAVDRASPVFQRVAAAAQAAATRYQGAAGRVDAAAGAIRTATAAMALPAIGAFGALIARTQDFEKALYGVQVAGIADNIKDGKVDFENLRKEAARTADEAMRLSKVMSMSPTGILKAGEAAGKMGLSAEKISKVMEMSTAVHMQDNAISPERAAEFLGSLGKQFGFEGAGRDYNAEITKAANQWLGVANMTRTSASRLEEGLRMFSPLFASMGESFLNSAALIGAMTQAGLRDDESGTALRSFASRMLNQTHQGRDAALVSGLQKEIMDRGLIDLSGVTSRQAFLNLKQTLPGQIKKGDEAELRKKLDEGEKGKKFTDAAYQNELFALVNRITGAKDAPTREAVQEKVLGSILTGGGKAKMKEIFELMAEMHEQGKLTESQLGKYFEGRQLARLLALFKMIRAGELERLVKGLKDINSEFTDAGTRLWNESDAGRWSGTVAAMDRGLIRLRSTEGIRAMVGAFESAANAFADLPRGVQQFAGYAVAASAAAGGLALALAGVSKAATVLAASPVMRALLLGGGAMAAFGGPMFQGIDRLDARDPGTPTFMGSGAPIWSTMERLQELGSELQGLWSDISGPVKELASEIQSLFGLDPNGSVLLQGLRGLNEAIKQITRSVREFRENLPSIMSGDLGSMKVQGVETRSWLDMWKALYDLTSGVGGKPGQPPATPGAAGGATNEMGNHLGLNSPMLRDLPPQKVDVQGQADVRVTNEITVKVEGPGQVTNQTANGGQASVPLNTGRSMPDAQ